MVRWLADHQEVMDARAFWKWRLSLLRGHSWLNSWFQREGPLRSQLAAVTTPRCCLEILAKILLPCATFHHSANRLPSFPSSWNWSFPSEVINSSGSRMRLVRFFISSFPRSFSFCHFYRLMFHLTNGFGKRSDGICYAPMFTVCSLWEELELSLKKLG